MGAFPASVRAGYPPAVTTRKLPGAGRTASRPYLIRAFIAGAVAVAGMVVASLYREEINRRDQSFSGEEVIVLVSVLVLVVTGVMAVRSLSGAAHAATGGTSSSKRTPLAFFINLIGYIVIAIAALESAKLGLEKVLLGGALTGVVIGIAAQQTLGNFFAGIVLLVVRPFSVGDAVYLKGSLGEYEGAVTDMTLFYVHMTTERGQVMLPNAGVLASAVGPGARAEKQKEREEAQTEPIE